MYWGKRRLMLPWLFLQGFLASILASLACYYIALFPLKKSCLVETSIEEDEPNFRPIVSTTRLVDGAEESGRSTCQVLLWYGAIMILSILILVYYFYIVHVSTNFVYIRYNGFLQVAGFISSWVALLYFDTIFQVKCNFGLLLKREFLRNMR